MMGALPCPVGNSLKFMPLDYSLNRDIMNSLRFHCVFSCFLLDSEGIDEEEKGICASVSLHQRKLPED